MNTTRFWSIIKRAAGSDTSDVAAHLERLRAALKTCSAKSLVEFQRHFDDCLQRAYTWDLWGAADLIVGGCGDDSFEDFRGWLVCQGRDVFESALADPDSLAEHIDPEHAEDILDIFGSVAADVWIEKTGADRSEFPRRGSNLGEDPAGEPHSPDDFPNRYPELSRRFEFTTDSPEQSDSDEPYVVREIYEPVAAYLDPKEYPDKPKFQDEADRLFALMKEHGIPFNADRPEMFAVPESQAEQAREIILQAIATKELAYVNIWPHVKLNR